MSSKRKRAISCENLQACVFCKTEDDDENVYGKLYHVKNISVHHNCLFFSSGLAQRTRNSNGILGFKIEDIKKEVSRGNKLRCCYCKHYGATVGCAVTSCRKTFHLPCGKNNRTLHQFFGSFNSYCESHKPVQKHIVTPRDGFNCHICFASLSRVAKEDRLYATCCKNNWCHTTCLQKYATSAGRYFFKCPMCNNSTDFIKVMETYGIDIPERDASWELEENAFQDLYCRPECGALICQCDQGKKHNDPDADEGKWELLFCELCGANARHRFCENLSRSVESWECSECKVLEDQLTKNVSQVPSEVPLQKICLTDHHSNEGSISHCEETCIYFYFSSDALKVTSISNIRRALRCVVQVTPVKFITDDNGVLKAVCGNKVTPVKLTNRNKLLLNIKMERRESKTITLSKSTELIEYLANAKRQLAANKRPIFKIKEINTINNQQIKEDLVSTASEKHAKIQKAKPVKVQKTKPVKAKPTCSKSVKTKPIKTNDSKFVNTTPVKFHSQNSHSSKKLCCSNNTCISKFFGFECPALKINRL